jgi:amino acid transporter
MTSTRSQQDLEAQRLEHFGYKQVLLRAMSGVRATMVNISTSSVTTAIFTLFAYGLVTGGTSFVWTWAIGFLVLLLVVLMFAELGSSMPIAGALYQWNSRMVGPKYGYYTAWLYIASQIAIVGAVAFGFAPFVASLFNATLTVHQQELVAIGIVLLCTAVNLIGVIIASGVAAIGAIAEVVGMLVLTGVLLITGLGNQSAGVLVHAHGLPPHSGFLAVGLAALLFGSWPYTGLEMTTDMAEETKDASKVIPRASITSLTTTFAVGMVLLIAAVIAIPGSIAKTFASANPLETIIVGNTSTTFYKVIIAVVCVAVFVCTMTNQALTARALFSLARDSKFPFARQVGHVPKSTRVPAVAITIVGVLACVLVLFTNAIAVIAVACLTGLFVCYLMVIWAQLIQRLRGRWTPHVWSLGRWSLTVNVLAVIFATALTVNIAWPRGTAPWYDRYSGFLFVAGSFLAAAVYYVVGGANVRKAINRHPLDTEGVGAEGAVTHDGPVEPSGVPMGASAPIGTNINTA